MGDSPDSSCISTKAALPDSFFKLDPPVPSQCSGQTVSWNPAFYPQPPDIQGFIPGGSAFRFPRPSSANATDLGWTVNLREGTQMVLLVRPASLSADNNAITSPLISVTGSQGAGCLAGSPSSTVKFTSSTAAPRVADPPTTTSTATTSPVEATPQAKNMK